MIARVRALLLASAAIGIAVLPMAATSRAANPAAPVVTLTRVSVPTTVATTCPTTGATTGQLAVDPTNSDDEVASWETGQGAEEWLGRSGDGGRTWTSSPLPGVATCSGQAPGGYVVDPYLAIAPGGAALATSSWQSSSNVAAGHGVLHVYLNRTAGTTASPGPAQDLDTTSTHGTQRAPVVVEPDQPSHVLVASEQALTVQAAGSAAPPLLAGAVTVARSTDGGASFAAPVTIDTALPAAGVLTAGMADTPEGLVVLTADISTGAVANYLAGKPLVQDLHAYRSTDDGRTFTGPTSVGTFTAPLSADEAAGCCIPDTASGNNGDIATVYADNTVAAVHLEQSHDGGATWTASTIPTPGQSATLATVSVLPDGGAAIAYDATETTAAGTTLRPMLTTTDAGGHATRTIPLAEPFLGSDAADGNNDPGLIGPEQDIATVPGGVRVLVTLADQPGEVAKDVEVYQASVVLDATAAGASPVATGTSETPRRTTVSVHRPAAARGRAAAPRGATLRQATRSLAYTGWQPGRPALALVLVTVAGLAGRRRQRGTGHTRRA